MLDFILNLRHFPILFRINVLNGILTEYNTSTRNLPRTPEIDFVPIKCSRVMICHREILTTTFSVFRPIVRKTAILVHPERTKNRV